MEKKLVSHIFTEIHHKTDHPFNFQILVGQLFAWAKLSKDQDLGELDFCRVLSHNPSPSKVLEILGDLSGQEPLGNNRRAFDFPESLRNPNDESKSLIAAILEISTPVLFRGEMDYTELLWNWGQEGEWEGFLPREMATLFAQLGRVQPEDTVYCPFDSSLWVAAAMDCCPKNIFFEGQNNSPLPYLVSLLTGKEMEIAFGDPVKSPTWLENKSLKKFDVSLAVPPFGVRYGKETPARDVYGRFPEKAYYGEFLGLCHVFSQTKKRAVVGLPPSVITRTRGGEYEFKQEIVERGNLEGAIKLPPHLLPWFRGSLSLLVLGRKGQNRQTFFVDVSSSQFRTQQKTLDLEDIKKVWEGRRDSEFSRLVTSQECKANHFNLDPQRYVFSETLRKVYRHLDQSKVIKIGEIADLINPQSLHSKHEKEGQEFFEVTSADIPLTGFIKSPGKKIRVSSKLLEKAKQQQLQPFDILVSAKGNLGQVGIVPKEIDGRWVAGQSFQVIRLLDRSAIIHPLVLHMFLRSEFGQSLLLANQVGSAVKILKAVDIKNLPIPVLSTEEQEKVMQSFQEEIEIEEKIEELRTHLQSLRQEPWGFSE